MKLTEKKIRDIAGRSGSRSGGGGGGGGVPASWVDENYVAIPYWSNLFEAVGTKTTTVGGGTPTTVDYTFDTNEKPETKTTTEGGVTTTVTTAVTGVKVKPHYLTGLLGINKTLYFDQVGTSYNVGIGVASPDAKLHVNGNSKLWGNIAMHGSISGLTNIDGLLYVENARVGIGVSYPSSKLHVSGNVTANNFIAGTADGSYIKIGPIRIEYEQSTNSLKVYNTTANTVANLYATGGISSLGIGSGGSGGGGSLADLSDVTLTNPSNGQILVYRNSHWVNENMPTPGGGGTVTSVGMSVPTGLLVSNGSSQTITSAGTFALTLATGYEIPLTADVNKGVTAYGWGDHALAGYLTGITDTMINAALGFTLSGTAGETYDLDAFLTGINASMINTALGFTLSGTAGDTYDLDDIGTLKGYFTNGVANEAACLTTTNKQAWGQTFWTTGGVPQDVNGNLDYVGNITMDQLTYPTIYLGEDLYCYIKKTSVSGSTYGEAIAIRVGGSGEQFNFRDDMFYSALEIRTSVGVYSAGYVTAASDINLKDKIGTPTLTTEDIASASPILFKWKDRKDQDVHVGAIAQEWQKLLPEVVRQQDGVLSMDYGVAALVSAMTIAKTVVNHEQRLTRLENELNKQKEL